MRAVVVLAGVALLLGAYVVLIEPRGPGADQSHTGHRRLLARFDRASVGRIAVRRRGQPDFVVERQPPGSKPSFRIIPGDLPADDAAVEDLLTAVDFAETERSADVAPAAAGLAPPAVTLAFEASTGSAQLHLGNPDATGGGVFAAVGAESDVRVAPRRLLELADRDPSAFRDRRLVPLDRAAVRSLDWTDLSGRSFCVSQDKDRPWVGCPREEPGRPAPPGRSGHTGFPVMGERVDESLRRLLALRVERFIEPPSFAASRVGEGRVELVAHGPGGALIVTITSTPCSGSGVVVVRQLADRRDGTCVEASALAAIWPTLAGAAAPDSRLLHSPPESVVAIDLFDAQRRVTLRRNSGGWIFLDPNPAYRVDAGAVADWLEALRRAECANVPNRVADRYLLVEGRYREGCDVASTEAAYPLLTPDPLRFRDRAALSFARMDARRLRRITRGPTGVAEVVSEESGSWEVAAPTGGPIDRAGVDRVIGALADLRVASFRAAAPPGRPEVSLEIDVRGPGDHAPVRHKLALFLAGAGPCTARLDGETTLTIAHAACDELRVPLLESQK